jgi:hypothetical protein
VQVDRDAGHAVDGEGPRRHPATEPGGVRQHPAADAGVDVAPHPRSRGDGGDRGHVVDDPVGVRRRRRDDEDGPLVERSGHRGRVGTEVVTHLDGNGFHPEVVGGLVERRVRRRRDDHPRPADLRTRVPGGLHSEEDGLGPAAGDGADDAVRGLEEVRGEADQLVLHLHQRRERGRVQAVGVGVGSHRLPGHRVHVGAAAVVDVGQRAPALRRQVAGLQRAEPGEHVGHRSPPGTVSERPVVEAAATSAAVSE